MSNIPFAYSITHEGLRLDIALVETEKLHIHEETIPERLENLRRRIERDGVQSAPILVDRHNLVVLDGMHRTAVMAYLKCRFTCVCMLDYFDDSINIQRWCRVIPGPFSERHAKDFLASVGLSMDPFEIVKSPDEDSGLLIAFRDAAYKLVSDSNDLVDLFKRSYQLELNLDEYGYEVKHCTESQAIDLMSSGYEATIYLPKVGKQQVVDIAINNQVFTPKATRHKLPARPLSLDIPLSLLRNTEISLEEANARLAQHLNKKTLTRYDQGAEWMGRTYDEVLYIFSDL